MRTQRVISLLVALIAACVTSPSQACMHPPAEYKGSIEQTSQAALIFFDGEREELVLKASYKVKKGKSPANLAWIVPVPQLPDHYAVESPRLFQELFRKMRPQRKRKGLRGMNERRIKVHKKEKIGEYTVQPIGVGGVASGAALNQWLQKNGFNQVPASNMRYYLERKYTFLAIQIDPAEGIKNLGDSGDFRPLRISFKTDALVYPIKFSSHQGQFDLTLYTVTPDEIIVPGPLGSNRVHKEFGLRRRAVRPIKLAAGNVLGMPSVMTLWSKIISEKRMSFSRALITRFDGPMMNRPTNPLSAWPRDLTLHMTLKPWAPFGFLD